MTAMTPRASMTVVVCAGLTAAGRTAGQTPRTLRPILTDDTGRDWCRECDAFADR